MKDYIKIFVQFKSHRWRKWITRGSKSIHKVNIAYMPTSVVSIDTDAQTDPIMYMVNRACRMQFHTCSYTWVKPFNVWGLLDKHRKRRFISSHTCSIYERLRDTAAHRHSDASESHSHPCDVHAVWHCLVKEGRATVVREQMGWLVNGRFHYDNVQRSNSRRYSQDAFFSLSWCCLWPLRCRRGKDVVLQHIHQ